MKPIGPLMREHRLIERMVKIMADELAAMEKSGRADTRFIAAAVDFVRTYADRTHHGKEEDILFRDLAGKPLSAGHRDIMRQLVEEHALARKLTGNIADARVRYDGGDTAALADIVENLRQLVAFYPQHIEKEDKHFFFPCLEYFTAAEQDAMLAEFWEFDRKLIHEKYEKLVTDIETAHNEPRSH